MMLSCNELENPIGIETFIEEEKGDVFSCCNELENPIGIENSPEAKEETSDGYVATNLKTR